jgi:hypothetical protein
MHDNANVIEQCALCSFNSQKFPPPLPLQPALATCSVACGGKELLLLHDAMHHGTFFPMRFGIFRGFHLFMFIVRTCFFFKFNFTFMPFLNTGRLK